MKSFGSVRGIVAAIVVAGASFLLPAVVSVASSSAAGASSLSVVSTSTTFSCAKGWTKVATATNLCARDETKTVAACNKSYADHGGTWIGGTKNNCYVEEAGTTTTVTTSLLCASGWTRVSVATNLCARDETKTVAACNKSFADHGGTWIGGTKNNCYVEEAGKTIVTKKVTR